MLHTPRASSDPAAFPFVVPVRVRFDETDAMGVVHHAAYLSYLEVARVEYLRSIGHPYDVVRAEGLEFPVAELGVRYLRPLYFDDVVEVYAAVADARGAAFEMEYLLTVGRDLRATAATRHAVVSSEGRPVRTPTWVRERTRSR